MMINDITETDINIVSVDTRLEGKIYFDKVSRVHGTLVGEIHSTQDSLLILCEKSSVEGKILADSLIVDGFVRGDIFATKKVKISSTGRVIGNINAPSILIEFGAYFEGKSLMSDPKTISPERATS